MSYLILEIKNKNMSEFVINFLYVWKNGMNTDKEKQHVTVHIYIYTYVSNVFKNINHILNIVIYIPDTT